MARSPRTLADVATAHLRESGHDYVGAAMLATRAVFHAWQWAVLLNLDGAYPSQRRFADHWLESERTVQRNAALVREAFPGEPSPERLARHIAAAGKGTADRWPEALTLPAPPPAVPA